MSSLPLSTRLEGLPPYVPGRRPEGRQADRTARLASNESPWAPHQTVVAAMRSAAEDAHRYPDMQYVELRARIAETVGVSPDTVAVANGSTALLRDIFAAVLEVGSEVVFAEASFAYYRSGILLAGGVPVCVPLRDHAHDLDAMHAAVTPATRAVVVCNPNNPTGTVVSESDLERFVERIPCHVAVILDEPYVEFADRVDGLRIARRHDNVIVTRTLSKAHGLAGIRVGYAVGAAAVIEAVSRVGVPFRIDAISNAGALAALTEAVREDTAQRVAHLIEERERVARALSSKGWTVVPSSANFLFLPIGDSAGATAAEWADRGVLVRPIAGGLRITIGSPEDNAQLLGVVPDRGDSA